VERDQPWVPAAPQGGEDRDEADGMTADFDTRDVGAIKLSSS